MGLYRIATATVLALFIAAPAAAQSEYFGIGEEKVRINLGLFFTDNDTTVQVNESDGDLGTLINLEDLLGLDSDVIAGRFDGYWRFARRHRLVLGYYSIERDATSIATEDIEFGDITIPAGSTVMTLAKTKIIPFGYAYSIVQSEVTEISFTIGGHWIDYEIALSSPELVISDRARIDGPLPMLGFEWEQAWGSSRRWRSIVAFQAFDLNFDAFDGSINNIRLAGEYALSRHFLLGLGYNWFSTDVSVDDDDWQGQLDWEYQGIQVYGSLKF